MAAIYTPTLRGRRLALELRKLRERADLNQAEAARRLNWNKNKLSRIEVTQTGISDDDVRALLQLYGLDADRHDAIIQLNKDSWQRGWWTAYGTAFPGNFAMLEEQAPEIYCTGNSLVPGILQTPDYARAVLEHRAGADMREIDDRVAVRMARKAVLNRADPVCLRAVIDEAVVRRQVGGPEVMGAQIAALWQAATRPNITLQIVPFEIGANTGIDGPFTLFAFPDEPDLDVAHSEGPLGEWYAESAAEVAKIRLAFACVSKVAMSPEETSEFLAALTRE